MVSSGPSQPTSNLRSKAASTELISIQEILFPMHILGPNPNGKLTNGLIYGNIKSKCYTEDPIAEYLDI